jgi:hypothetical protein
LEVILVPPEGVALTESTADDDLILLEGALTLVCTGGGK